MQERRISTAAPPSVVMMPCSFEDALYLVNDGDLSRTIRYVVDVVDIVDTLDILISTGCPISLGPLSFCHFLGFWSTYRGTFHSHRIAHEILIPKLTLLSILREILTKLQHKT